MEEKLKKLLNNSYAPYSKFFVSAICVMKDGKEFNGVNVENASYGSSICAERSAILSAISSGYKKHDFKEINIMCSSNIIAYPCMQCRQVFLELFDKNVIVNCYNSLGKMESHTVSDLCPYPFDEENL